MQTLQDIRYAGTRPICSVTKGGGSNGCSRGVRRDGRRPAAKAPASPVGAETGLLAALGAAAVRAARLGKRARLWRRVEPLDLRRRLALGRSRARARRTKIG
jgi:hypothetical protein